MSSGTARSEPHPSLTRLDELSSTKTDDSQAPPADDGWFAGSACGGQDCRHLGWAHAVRSGAGVAGRIDQKLAEGVADVDIDRRMQSACTLCSNGCACDIASKDNRMVGVGWGLNVLLGTRPAPVEQGENEGRRG